MGSALTSIPRSRAKGPTKQWHYLNSMPHRTRHSPVRSWTRSQASDKVRSRVRSWDRLDCRIHLALHTSLQISGSRVFSNASPLAALVILGPSIRSAQTLATTCRRDASRRWTKNGRYRALRSRVAGKARRLLHSMRHHRSTTSTTSRMCPSTTLRIWSPLLDVVLHPNGLQADISHKTSLLGRILR